MKSFLAGLVGQGSQHSASPSTNESKSTEGSGRRKARNRAPSSLSEAQHSSGSLPAGTSRSLSASGRLGRGQQSVPLPEWAAARNARLLQERRSMAAEAEVQAAAGTAEVLQTVANELAQPGIDETPALADELEDVLLREDSCYAYLGSSPSSASTRSGGGGKHSTSSCGVVRPLESSSEDEDAATGMWQQSLQEQVAVLAEALHSASSSYGSGESGSCDSVSLSSTDSAGFARPPGRRSVRRRRRAIPRAACQQEHPDAGSDAPPPLTALPPPLPPPARVPPRRQGAGPAAGAPGAAPQLQASTAPAGAVPVPMHLFVDQRPDSGRDPASAAAAAAATAAAAAAQQQEEARRCAFDLVAWPQGNPLAANPRYSCVRKLSRGCSGFVLQCKDLQSRRHVAIKFILRDSHFKQDIILRELQNQRLCRGHPHIIQLLDVFVLPEHLAIVMEYADCGNLAEFISSYVHSHGRGLPEVEARCLMQQLVAALRYAHGRGVANRDVKLDNILLASDPEALGRPTLKLADFGFSKNESQSRCKTSCGTPEYIAPEVLQAGPYDGTLADTWGAGVVMYILLAGAFPFLTMGEEALPPLRRLHAMVPRIMAGRPIDLPQPASPPCQALLLGLLRADPAARLTLPAAAAHPWLALGMPAGLATLNDRLQEAAGAVSDAEPWPEGWQEAVRAAALPIHQFECRRLRARLRRMERSLSGPGPSPPYTTAPRFFDDDESEDQTAWLRRTNGDTTFKTIKSAHRKEQ